MYLTEWIGSCIYVYEHGKICSVSGGREVFT